MENNYQEAILENMLYKLGTGQEEYSQFRILTTMRDCFAISRIQAEISELSPTAIHNDSMRIKLTNKYDELDAILEKYPEAVKPTK